MPLVIGSIATAIVCGFLAYLIRKHRNTPWEWWREMAAPSENSLRCSACCVQWPDDPEYRPCPECGGKVWNCASAPIDRADAHSRMTHSKFEKWLDANNRRDPVEVLERIPVEEKAA